MVTDEIKWAFGLAVKLARTRRGWTQDRLGSAAGLDRGHVSRIESGERDVAISTQAKIAAALGVSLSELVAQAEEELARNQGRSGRADDPALGTSGR